MISATFRPIRCFVRPSTFDRTPVLRLPPASVRASHSPRGNPEVMHATARRDQSGGTLGRFRRGRGMNGRCAPTGQVVGHSRHAQFSRRFRQQYKPRTSTCVDLTWIRTHPFGNLFAVDLRIPQMPKRKHLVDQRNNGLMCLDFMQVAVFESKTTHYPAVRVFC